MPVECSQTGTVAVLHSSDLQRNASTTFRPFHPLGQRITDLIQIRHDLIGFQTQESFVFFQCPSLIHGVVVPLPLHLQLIPVELIAYDQGDDRPSFHRNFHRFGYMPVLIAQHGPTVNPATRGQSQHTPHAAPVLENHTIPISLGIIHNRSLSHIGETGKIIAQNDLLFVWSGNLISPIT